MTRSPCQRWETKRAMHLRAVCKTQNVLFTICSFLSPALSLFLFFSGHRSGAFSGPAYRRAAEGLWDTTDCWGVCWPVQVWPDRSGLLLGQRHGEVDSYIPVSIFLVKRRSRPSQKWMLRLFKDTEKTFTFRTHFTGIPYPFQLFTLVSG